MNISCRIANADTQCGRITNPPEREIGAIPGAIIGGIVGSIGGSIGGSAAIGYGVNKYYTK